MTTYSKSNRWAVRSFWPLVLQFPGLMILGGVLSRPSVSVALADMVTDENVAVKIEAAATAEDHRNLAAYFSSKTSEAAKEFKLHEDMGQSYRRRGKADGIAITMQSHCKKLMNLARESQETYQTMSEVHGGVAKELAK